MRRDYKKASATIRRLKSGSFNSKCSNCGYSFNIIPTNEWQGNLRCPTCSVQLRVNLLDFRSKGDIMTKGKTKEVKPVISKPVKTVDPSLTVKGVELGNLREKIKSEELIRSSTASCFSYRVSAKGILSVSPEGIGPLYAINMETRAPGRCDIVCKMVLIPI